MTNRKKERQVKISTLISSNEHYILITAKDGTSRSIKVEALDLKDISKWLVLDTITLNKIK